MLDSFALLDFGTKSNASLPKVLLWLYGEGGMQTYATLIASLDFVTKKIDNRNTALTEPLIAMYCAH